MNEALLQFIWQHSLYQPGSLQTTDGMPIVVVMPGMRNTNAGPDFSEARLKIGDTLLVGNVELHVNSSDWLKHGHQTDAAYQKLILHVVYNNDIKDVAGDTHVLELKQHIQQDTIARYTDLVQAVRPLPCAGHLDSIRSITKEGWLSRLLAERWEEKLLDWKELLASSANDWRNLLYWRMAANFGFKVNATPFLMLARSIPLNVLARHKDNLMQIEALLFGQAGMLTQEFEEQYPQQLQKEYQYLQQKYQLQPVSGHLWKFMRMRPANFPTVRIAQFAALVHKSIHLFSQILETNTVKEIEPLLDVIAGEYWDTHFRFDELQAKPGPKHLGMSSVHNIIINTIAPIRFLYAQRTGAPNEQERALQLLEGVPAEANNIMQMWHDNKWPATNAAQSQALIQLHNKYCNPRRCLECTIGLNAIRSRP